MIKMKNEKKYIVVLSESALDDLRRGTCGTVDGIIKEIDKNKIEIK